MLKSQSRQHFPETNKRSNRLQSQCVQCSSYGSNPKPLEREEILKLCYDSWLKLELKDSLPIHPHLADWAMTALVLFNTTHIQELTTTVSRRTKILMWTGYWWEFTAEVVTGSTKCSLAFLQKAISTFNYKQPSSTNLFFFIYPTNYCVILCHYWWQWEC